MSTSSTADSRQRQQSQQRFNPQSATRAEFLAQIQRLNKVILRQRDANNGLKETIASHESVISQLQSSLRDMAEELNQAKQNQISTQHEQSSREQNVNSIGNDAQQDQDEKGSAPQEHSMYLQLLEDALQELRQFKESVIPALTEWKESGLNAPHARETTHGATDSNETNATGESADHNDFDGNRSDPDSTVITSSLSQFEITLSSMESHAEKLSQQLNIGGQVGDANVAAERQYKSLEQTIASLNSDLAQASSARDAAVSTAGLQRSRAETLAKQLDSLRKELEDQRQETNTAKSESRRLKTQLEDAQSVSRSAIEQAELLRRKSAENEASAAAGALEEVASLRQQCSGMETVISELKNSHQHTLSTMESQMQDLESKLHSVTLKNSRLEATISSSADAKQAALDELAALKSESSSKHTIDKQIVQDIRTQAAAERAKLMKDIALSRRGESSANERVKELEDELAVVKAQSASNAPTGLILADADIGIIQRSTGILRSLTPGAGSSAAIAPQKSQTTAELLCALELAVDGVERFVLDNCMTDVNLNNVADSYNDPGLTTPDDGASGGMQEFGGSLYCVVLGTDLTNLVSSISTGVLRLKNILLGQGNGRQRDSSGDVAAENVGSGVEYTPLQPV